MENGAMASQFLAGVVLAAVILGWFAHAMIFLWRKRPRAEERRRDRWSVAGIVMQGTACGIVCGIRRPWCTPIVRTGLAIDIVLAVATIAVLLVSLWISWAAVRALGRQWSYAARLLKEHTLITEGPYRIVRHPIYAGLLGMLIAGGLAVSDWRGFLVALAVFLAGTGIRIRSEEKLLREAFGRGYDEYAEEVPAIVPYGRRF